MKKRQGEQSDFIKTWGGKLGAKVSRANVIQLRGMQAKTKGRQRNNASIAMKFSEI